jgi:co-chaperonin GroES (HSP10)
MFRPVNRFILVDIEKKREDKTQSLVMLPEDYKPREEKFAKVTAVSAAEDVRFAINSGDKLIIDQGMMEQISIGDTIYNVILDNYVVGITK